MSEDFLDDFDGIDWQDWMIIGPLSEQIAEKERERDRLQREFDADADRDYWDIIEGP